MKDLSIKNGCKTTISCGVKMYHNEDIDTFVDQADQAMYSAKRSGKNQVVDFDDSPAIKNTARRRDL